MQIVVADQLGTTLGSVKMLHARVRLILDYLKSVQCGEILPDSAILREIYCLTCQLPVLDNLSFEKSFTEVSLPNVFRGVGNIQIMGGRAHSTIISGSGIVFGWNGANTFS